MRWHDATENIEPVGWDPLAIARDTVWTFVRIAYNFFFGYASIG